MLEKIEEISHFANEMFLKISALASKICQKDEGTLFCYIL